MAACLVFPDIFSIHYIFLYFKVHGLPHIDLSVWNFQTFITPITSSYTRMYFNVHGMPHIDLPVWNFHDVMSQNGCLSGISRHFPDPLHLHILIYFKVHWLPHIDIPVWNFHDVISQNGCMSGISRRFPRPLHHIRMYFKVHPRKSPERTLPLLLTI